MPDKLLPSQGLPSQGLPSQGLPSQGLLSRLFDKPLQRKYQFPNRWRGPSLNHTWIFWLNRAGILGMLSTIAIGIAGCNPLVKKLEVDRTCSRCDLKGARLSGLDLRGADLTYANLTKAVVIETNLNEANLSGATLTGADMRKTQLVSALLVQVDLTRANLYQANLSGADLRGATLKEANLRDAILPGAQLADASLADVDLRGANLDNADLRGANLTNAKLSGTDFSRARLVNANLQGADLAINAKNLNQGILCNTTLPDGQVTNRDCQRLATRPDRRRDRRVPSRRISSSRAEPRGYLQSLIRAQTLLYRREGRFTNSISELNIGISPETQNYRYAINTALGNQVKMTAIAKQDQMYSYTAVIFVILNEDNQPVTLSRICRSDNPSKAAPPVPFPPTRPSDKIECVSGSTVVQ